MFRCACRSGGGEAEVVARGIEGDAELARVAADLGEEKAALNACHGRGCKRGEVGVFAQLAAGLHARQAVADMRFPAVEAGTDGYPCLWVVLRELADEGADRAAAARVLADLMLDHEVEPAVDASPGVEVVKELALITEHGVGGDVDYGADEVVAVLEVVVELAAAGAGARTDVVEAHAGGALLDDELGCGLQDPLARCTTFRRRGCLSVRHDADRSQFGLDSPISVGYIWTV
jgi:hypothetical protein